MKNENNHAYSWAEQQRRDRRYRQFEVAAIVICALGMVGTVTLFFYMLSA